MKEPAHMRPYRYTDQQAVELSSQMLLQYNAHLAEFMGFDPERFDAAFATAWATDHAAARAMPTDEYTLDVLQGHTDALATTMQQGHAAMADLRYFVHKAYGTAGRARVFHFWQHAKARYNSLAYSMYLHVQHGMAQQHWADLSAKGMTPAHLTALTDAATAIHTADLTQELYKRERTALTIQRSELMIRLYAYLQHVNAAADVVFASDPIKRALFNLG